MRSGVQAPARRVARALALALGPLALGVAACNALLGLGDYAVVEADAGPGDAGARETGDEGAVRADTGGTCEDPTGLGGRGCFACAPEASAELLNACTAAGCTPFDNAARIAGFADAGLRGVPPPEDAGAGEPVDGGDADGASDGGADASDGGSGNPPCRDLVPRPVYLLGSSALYPVTLGFYAQALAGEVTLVYAREASCNGLDAILTQGTRVRGTASYWVGDVERRCDVDAPDGIVADVGLCDAFPETCDATSLGLPPYVGDFPGPVQVFMFTVPGASAERAISAEGAFDVFGYADAPRTAPWTDARYVFKRFERSGTQLVLAASIGLPAPLWRGVSIVSSGAMKPALLAAPEPAKAIGITSADVADQLDSRTRLRTLAYQHHGQACGFLPDSEPGSYDKRNVRDGHYFLWAPFHFYARLQNGAIPDPRVADVVSWLTGAKALPDRNLDVLSALKGGGLVPRCAMRVARDKEGGPLRPLAPRPSCGCAFEAAPPGGAAGTCRTCTRDADCAHASTGGAVGVCRFGYCEAE